MNIYALDPSTGATRLSVETDFIADGMAAADGLIYAISNTETGCTLRTIDINTTAVSEVGDIAGETIHGLTWDGSNLYAIDTSGYLIRIDREDASTAIIGSTAFRATTGNLVQAMAWDPEDDVLLAVFNGRLQSIDKATAAVTEVGVLTVAFHAMSFVGTTLYGISENSVYTINKGSASIEEVSPHGLRSVTAVAVVGQLEDRGFLPSAPRQHVVSNADYEDYTLGWDLPIASGGSPLTGFRVQLRKKTVAGDEPWQTHYAAAGEVELVWPETLEFGETYQSRVAAQNANGHSVYSNVAEAVAIAFPDPPNEFYAVGIDVGQAYVHFAEPIDNGGSPVESYEFEYRPKHVDGAEVVSISVDAADLTAARRISDIDPHTAGKSIAPADVNDVTALIVPDLRDTVLYEGRMRCANALDDSDWTEWDDFRGLEEAAVTDSFIPRDVPSATLEQADEANPTHLTITCPTVERGRGIRFGSPRQYELELWESGIDTGTRVGLASIAPTASIIIDDDDEQRYIRYVFGRKASEVITGDRAYFGRARAANTLGGTWVLTTPPSITLGRLPIGRVVDLSAAADPNVADGVILSFTEPTPAASIAGYEVERTVNDVVQAALPTQQATAGTGRARTIALTGISAGDAVSFRIRPVNTDATADVSEWSNRAAYGLGRTGDGVINLVAWTLAGSKAGSQFTAAEIPEAIRPRLNPGKAYFSWEDGVEDVGWHAVEIRKSPDDGTLIESGVLRVDEWVASGMDPGQAFLVVVISYNRNGTEIGRNSMVVVSPREPGVPTITSAADELRNRNAVVRFERAASDPETSPAPIRSDVSWMNNHGGSGIVSDEASPISVPLSAARATDWTFRVRDVNIVGIGAYSQPEGLSSASNLFPFSIAFDVTPRGFAVGAGTIFIAARVDRKRHALLTYSAERQAHVGEIGGRWEDKDATALNGLALYDNAFWYLDLENNEFRTWPRDKDEDGSKAGVTPHGGASKYPADPTGDRYEFHEIPVSGVQRFCWRRDHLLFFTSAMAYTYTSGGFHQSQNNTRHTLPLAGAIGASVAVGDRNSDNAADRDQLFYISDSSTIKKRQAWALTRAASLDETVWTLPSGSGGTRLAYLAYSGSSLYAMAIGSNRVVIHKVT